MEYFKDGKAYFFENILSPNQLQLFLNGELEGEYLRDVVIDKTPYWTGFKNTIFNNSTLLLKCLPCNAYVLLADMIVSAEAGANVLESNFLIGWNLLKSELTAKGTPLLQSEIDFINAKLVEFEFTITI